MKHVCNSKTSWNGIFFEEEGWPLLEGRFVQRPVAVEHFTDVAAPIATAVREIVDATPSDVNLREEGGVAMRSGRLGLSAIR
jgi:hypothetical protein